MGAAVSTQTQDLTNSIVNDISQKISNTCDQSQKAIQSIDINLGNVTGCGIYVSANMSNTGNFNSNCQQINVSSTDLQTIMKNNLDSFIQTKTEALSFSADVNTAVQNLKNFINNNVNMETISKAISEQMATQTFKFEAGDITCTPLIINGELVPGSDRINFDNLNQNLNLTSVNNALQSNTQYVSLVNDLDNSLKAKSYIEQKGLAQILGAVFGPLIVIGIVIVIVVVVTKSKSRQSTSGLGGRGF